MAHERRQYTREYKVEAVRLVDVHQRLGTQCVRLVWRGGFLSFSADLVREEGLVEVVSYLHASGALLSERAEALLLRVAGSQ